MSPQYSITLYKYHKHTYFFFNFGLIIEYELQQGDWTLMVKKEVLRGTSHLWCLKQ